MIQNQIAPKWLVFIFDNLICLFAILLAIFLIRHLNYRALFIERSQVIIISVVITNIFFFYIFKTYEGIIRFSGFAELVRVAGSLLASFVSLLFLGFFTSILNGKLLVPTSILIVNLLTSIFLMVGYRLIVKSLYKNSIKSGKPLNVILFGGGSYGSKIKQTIEQGSGFKYQVLAFIENDNAYIGKSIDNVKVFSFEQIKEVAPYWDVAMLIFAKENLDSELKNQVVDFCHGLNIEVRNLPRIEDWINGTGNLNQLEKINIEELLGRRQIQIHNPRVEELVNQKSILVTGAAGSIGSEIARQIASLNPLLLILCDQNESGLYELEYEIKTNFPACTNVVVFIGSVRDSVSMENLFERFRPNIVYHAAAYKHVPMMEAHSSEAVRNNVLGTKVLADLSVEYGIERFLLISTDKAINPTNVMGASKRVAEIYVQALGNREKKVVHLSQNINSNIYTKESHGTKFITTRFGNVLGSNGSVIPRFKEQISKGGPVTVTHPEIIRYFMTIAEACSLVLEASAMGQGGEIFLFDMGSPVKIVDLAKKMIRLAGYTPNKDIEIKFSGLRPGEKLFEELLNDQEQVIPTHHKKILIAKVVEYDFYQVNKSIDQLIESALQSQDEEVVRQMKRIIPEFISNNSVYSAIDNIKADTEKIAIS
ncbi:MAG: polysaccharide biosynthesis protein [Chitinophagaceae bacterium]|nr:polysaccharide biosynthesis protein [Chitinophagaceae bacterium]